MNGVSQGRTRRMILMALCALSVHALVLYTVHLEAPQPTPMPPEAGITVSLVESPPEHVEPPAEPVEEALPPEPERVEETPPPVPAEPIVKPAEKKKARPKPRQKPTPRPSVPAKPSGATAPVTPTAEEAPAFAPTIQTPLQNRKPVYPELARKRGQQGKVLLRATIDEGGTLTDLVVQTSSGHSMLDDAALKAVRRWKFTPAMRGGAPRKGTLLIPVTFMLKE